MDIVKGVAGVVKDVINHHFDEFTSNRTVEQHIFSKHDINAATIKYIEYLWKGADLLVHVTSCGPESFAGTGDQGDDLFDLKILIYLQ